VARHIFQACPVWIYTQSNITQAVKCLFSHAETSLEKNNTTPTPAFSR
jgi:hypothetical protein